MNIYSKIIIDELDKRNIKYNFLDENKFEVFTNKKNIFCHESLSSKTSKEVIQTVSNKHKTNEILRKNNINTPYSKIISNNEEGLLFLEKYKKVVVKPNNSEQGKGISIGIKDKEQLISSINVAKEFSNEIILEEFASGIEYRVVIIDYVTVAVSKKIPAYIIGDGKKTIYDLINIKNEIINKKTGGESKITIDTETQNILKEKELTLNSVLPKQEYLQLKYLANLHMGAEFLDVTNSFPEKFKRISSQACKIIDIPVSGVDIIISEDYKKYWIIELNERPGLANHEPQPTAEKFVDFILK